MHIAMHAVGCAHCAGQETALCICEVQCGVVSCPMRVVSGVGLDCPPCISVPLFAENDDRTGVG
jgi:hypothetical protein